MVNDLNYIMQKAEEEADLRETEVVNIFEALLQAANYRDVCELRIMNAWRLLKHQAD